METPDNCVYMCSCAVPVNTYPNFVHTIIETHVEKDDLMISLLLQPRCLIIQHHPKCVRLCAIRGYTVRPCTSMLIQQGWITSSCGPQDLRLSFQP